MYPKLIHPFRMLIAGPSGCGKSTFVNSLLNNLDMVDVKFNKIFWCNPEVNALPTDLNHIKNLKFLDFIPNNFNNEQNKPMLIVLDDILTELDSNAEQSICELFTKGSHHRNISVILITQNIFNKGKYTRTCSLNATYIVFFKNPRDLTQFNYLARQIYPENFKALQNLYKRITQKGHTYIFIDLSQGTNDLLRFQTDLFNKKYSTCYCDKKLLKQENGFSIESIKGQQAYSTSFKGCKSKA